MTTQTTKNKEISLKISLIIIIYFINVISTQQQSCATIDDISQEICASFSQLSDCLIELEITIGGREYFSEQVTLLQLANSNGQTFCAETSYNGCDLCFYWEETAVQQEGTEEGCLSLSSSCLSSPLYLGCFNDQSVSLCHHECPNNCTGKGECQTSGVCDCFPSYRGDDCSSQCESGKEGMERMEEGERNITLKEGENYKGYIEIDPQLAFLGIIGSIKEENKKISVYIEKSCFPDPNLGFYDDYFDASDNLIGISKVVRDCNQLDGGLWFVLAFCSSLDNTNPSSNYSSSVDCSFSLTVLQEEVEELTAGKTISNEINSPEDYFSFSVFSLFTIELISTSPSLQLLLMKSQCPLDDIFLFSSSHPFYFDVNINNDNNININNNNNGEGEGGEYYIYKYIISSPSASQGVYFLRVRDTSFQYSSQYALTNTNNNINNNININNINNKKESKNINNNNINNNNKYTNKYNVTMSYVTCGFVCEFGICSSHDQCRCMDGFGGYKCDQPIINNTPPPPPINTISISTLSSHDDNNNNDQSSNESSNNNDKDDNKEGKWGWVGAVSATLLLAVVLLLFLACCFVCCFAIVKKRKNAQKLSPNNLYNLLTSELDQ